MAQAGNETPTPDAIRGLAVPVAETPSWIQRMGVIAFMLRKSEATAERLNVIVLFKARLSVEAAGTRSGMSLASRQEAWWMLSNHRWPMPARGRAGSGA
jgi:hypothetical protein